MLALGTWLLKNWQGLALAVAIGVVVFCVQLAGERNAELKVANQKAADATASANAWHDFSVKQTELASETAQAHAAEVKNISNIKSAAVAAKEGASHAPGAADRFVYSDAAYRFLRAPPAGAPAQPAAESDAHVDGH